MNEKLNKLNEKEVYDEVKIIRIKQPYSWKRFVGFYRRNYVGFWCVGLISTVHFFWWQIQQNVDLVPADRRKKMFFGMKIPYLDEKEEKK
jgi:hypothetical protein